MLENVNSNKQKTS